MPASDASVIHMAAYSDAGAYPEPVTGLRGLGGKRAELLLKLGVGTRQDLLFYFPRAYDDRSGRCSISAIRENAVYTFFAKVANEPSLQRKGKLSWIRARLTDGAAFLDAIWFNQPWIRNRLQVGGEYLFHGNVKINRGKAQIQNPVFQDAAEDEDERILPIYGLTRGLTQTIVRSAVRQVLDSTLPGRMTDPVADILRRKYKLCTLEFALRAIHFPNEAHDAEIARRRLAFEELFLTRSALALMKEKRSLTQKGRALMTGEESRAGLARLRERLPFSLTRSQMTAINEILRDLRRDKPMNRLLQGDVGSGKTMVAAFAMAYVAWNGGQSMLMAPTSILAEQHMHTLSSFFRNEEEIRLALLTSGTAASERKKILEACGDGTCHILIGTHALLQDDVQFKRLDLTITDEQHRFGVKQRGKLSERGEGVVPHRLVMSATPIPRTLALILYGDLDLSIMKDMPTGRKAVSTYIAKSSDMRHVYDLMRREMDEGAQIYVVCPLIDESENLEAESAMAVAEKFSREIFPDRGVALLHGQMKQEEKDRVMSQFMARQSQILVSTTVVEVGVDNPNASLILILNAERFGLAQLHQLRGRVGRGKRASYCILQTDAGDSLASERLQTLCRHSSGFDLAEEDLRLRGPGDFFGTRQHGLPAFRLVNLYEDSGLIREVEEALTEIRELPLSEREKAERNIRRAIAERYPELNAGLTL